MVHPEKNTGRFGVSTNQTLKYNDHLKVQEKAVGYWTIIDEDGNKVHEMSLGKNKAWELIEKAADYRSADETSTASKKDLEEEKRKVKRDEFKKKMNKSKHEQRLERKEQQKIKKQQEKQKEEKESNSSSSDSDFDDRDYFSDESPTVICIPMYEQMVGNQRRSYRHTSQPSTIEVSAPLERDVLFKKGQFSERNNYHYCYRNTESRKEKKENFKKSIFL